MQCHPQRHVLHEGLGPMHEQRLLCRSDEVHLGITGGHRRTEVLVPDLDRVDLDSNSFTIQRLAAVFIRTATHVRLELRDEGLGHVSKCNAFIHPAHHHFTIMLRDVQLAIDHRPGQGLEVHAVRQFEQRVDVVPRNEHVRGVRVAIVQSRLPAVDLVDQHLLLEHEHLPHQEDDVPGGRLHLTIRIGLLLLERGELLLEIGVLLLESTGDGTMRIVQTSDQSPELLLVLLPHRVALVQHLLDTRLELFVVLINNAFLPNLVLEAYLLQLGLNLTNLRVRVLTMKQSLFLQFFIHLDRILAMWNMKKADDVKTVKTRVEKEPEEEEEEPNPLDDAPKVANMKKLIKEITSNLDDGVVV